MLRRSLMILYIAATQASSLYVATQDISRCVGSILLRINASLEYISDYLCIQQNPSRDAGISCSLPGASPRLKYQVAIRGFRRCDLGLQCDPFLLLQVPLPGCQDYHRLGESYHILCDDLFCQGSSLLKTRGSD